MKIFIPTFNRPTHQPVLERFLSCGIHPTLVVRSKADLPKGYSKYIVCREPGIRAKRKLLLDRFLRKEKYMMIDDDLTIFRNAGNGLERDFPFEEFVNECDRISSSYGISGVHPRFMINTREKDWEENTKIYHVMMVNGNKIPSSLQLKYRMETCEDHDIHLQYLTSGHPSAVTCKFCHVDKENAPGGCSEWRTDPLQDVEELIGLWPEYVRKNKHGRPVIQFKKAYKQNQGNA